MTKVQFTDKLRRHLKGLSDEDIQSSLDFYGEIIDDLTDAGKSEADAVASLGSPDAVAKEILLDMPLPKVIKNRCKKIRRLHAWEVVLLAIGSVVWVPLLLVAVVLLLTVYVILWTVVACLWVVDATLVALFVGGIPAGVAGLSGGLPWSGIFNIGVALLSAGIAVFGFFGCIKLTVLFAKISVRFARWIKSWFIQKEADHVDA